MTWKQVEEIVEKLLKVRDPLIDREITICGQKLKASRIGRGNRFVHERRESFAKMICNEWTIWGCVKPHRPRELIARIDSRAIVYARRFRMLYTIYDPHGDIILPNLLYRASPRD